MYVDVEACDLYSCCGFLLHVNSLNTNKTPEKKGKISKPTEQRRKKEKKITKQ